MLYDPGLHALEVIGFLSHIHNAFCASCQSPEDDEKETGKCFTFENVLEHSTPPPGNELHKLKKISKSINQSTNQLTNQSLNHAG